MERRQKKSKRRSTSVTPVSRRVQLPWGHRLYKLLEYYFLTDKKYGELLYAHINAHDPGLTVCPECRIDDYTHVEGCKLADMKLKDLDIISPYAHHEYRVREA